MITSYQFIQAFQKFNENNDFLLKHWLLQPHCWEEISPESCRDLAINRPWTWQSFQKKFSEPICITGFLAFFSTSESQSCKPSKSIFTWLRLKHNGLVVQFPLSPQSPSEVPPTSRPSEVPNFWNATDPTMPWLNHPYLRKRCKHGETIGFDLRKEQKNKRTQNVLHLYLPYVLALSL